MPRCTDEEKEETPCTSEKDRTCVPKNASTSQLTLGLGIGLAMLALALLLLGVKAVPKIRALRPVLEYMKKISPGEY